MNTLTHLCTVAVLATGACSAPRPTTITHVVLIKLDDPGKAPAALGDCDRLLPGIDGVSSYWSGTPDRSRSDPSIDDDWDIALCVGYPDAEAYASYVVDPAHVELVQTWRPSIEWLRIHDVTLHRAAASGSTLRE